MGGIFFFSLFRSFAKTTFDFSRFFSFLFLSDIEILPGDPVVQHGARSWQIQVLFKVNLEPFMDLVFTKATGHVKQRRSSQIVFFRKRPYDRQRVLARQCFVGVVKEPKLFVEEHVLQPVGFGRCQRFDFVDHLFQELRRVKSPSKFIGGDRPSYRLTISYRRSWARLKKTCTTSSGMQFFNAGKGLTPTWSRSHAGQWCSGKARAVKVAVSMYFSMAL